MHKGRYFQNESQFNNCLLKKFSAREPKCLTGVALGIGIVSTCEETTCEILPIGSKALFCVLKHKSRGHYFASLTSNFKFFASNYPFVSTFEH